MKTTVRLISRGEEHPYVIEITTPGWRGCDAAFRGKLELPRDLKQISDLLDQAGVKRWRGDDGKAAMCFVADGTTEIVLADAPSVEPAIEALMRAGWLSPEVSPKRSNRN
jgi:hypothetical protein